MNIRACVILCVLVTMTCTVTAHAGDTGWVGVWQGRLNGQPSVILTLAEDNGTLEGTLVLNIVSRDGGLAHIVAHEPHVLMHPQANRSSLSFRLKRIDGSNDLMDFTVILSDSSSGSIHCSNCGSEAPTVAMTKQD
jgi:hypothetical protein